MIVDYNLFTPGEVLAPGSQKLTAGTLWVVEQIPGLVMGQDVTDILEKGYWASYNIPFFPEIYELSGYPAVVQQAGVRQSYQMAPRAQIFRRDQGNVVDMDSMKVRPTNPSLSCATTTTSTTPSLRATLALRSALALILSLTSPLLLAATTPR